MSNKKQIYYRIYFYPHFEIELVILLWCGYECMFLVIIMMNFYSNKKIFLCVKQSAVFTQLKKKFL